MKISSQLEFLKKTKYSEEKKEKNFKKIDFSNCEIAGMNNS